MKWMLILFQGQFFKGWLRKIRGKKETEKEPSFENAIFLSCLIFIFLEIPSSILTMESQNFRNRRHLLKIIHSIFSFCSWIPSAELLTCWIQKWDHFPIYNSVLRLNWCFEDIVIHLVAKGDSIYRTWKNDRLCLVYSFVPKAKFIG